MKNILTFTILSAFLLLTACSNDDDAQKNDSNTYVNEVSFDISGAVEAEKKGSSYIVVVAGSTYMISNNDGTSASDQTFSLAFYKNFQDNSTSNPAVGTYPIGTAVDLVNEDGFLVVYTDTQTGKDYSKDVSGTLTITNNSNNQLRGTFEFAASNHNQGESVQVTNGKFSAAID